MLASAVEPGRGPRRYMAGGHYVTWQEWTDLLSAAEGTHIAQQHVTREEMIQLGRDFDRQRQLGVDVTVPLTEEAAEIMTAGVPTDDSLMLEDLGITYRRTTETFADTITWLRSTGRLPTR